MKAKPIDTTPFDRRREPPRQNPFFLPLMWLLCWLITRPGRLRIHRVRMEGLKPPFLVLGTHHAFMDFYITPLALFPHRANYISELEGFENFGEWLYRQAGCLGTRKFVNDLALVKNIRRVVDRGDILVLYPEARYANVGTSSALPDSVGKLCKLLGVPVVVINMHGNYLRSPIWNLKRRRGVRLETEIRQLFTRDELKSAGTEEIQRQIERALAYDEYAWQYERGMRLRCRSGAEGLERVLYRCFRCSKEFEMGAKGNTLFCRACGARWHMTELGRLEEDGQSIHIPDWYEWQRKEVMAEIDSGSYALRTRVRIESLPNAQNFIDLGGAFLTHGREGFALTFTEYGQTQEETLRFSSMSMASIHTEYDYRGKGPCITLSTLDNTYFLYPLEPGFNVTKIQFATEYFYKLAQSEARAGRRADARRSP